MKNDRIRFRRNPPNISVPQGSDDLYFDAAGHLVHESQGGTKSSLLTSDTNGITGAIPIYNTVALTTAEYDAIAEPDANTHYIITDAPEVSGVNTGDETTASLEEKLEGATIQPAILALPDFGAAIAPLGALGTRGLRLALGNGVDTDDFLTARSVAGITTVDLTGTSKLSARFALVEIPYTAAEAVAGAAVNISGTVNFAFNPDFFASEEPVISMTIGFAHTAYKTDAKTKWLSYNCLPTGTEYPFEIRIRPNLKANFVDNVIAGADKIVLTDLSSDPKSDRWAGVAGETFIQNSIAIVYVDPSDTSVAVTEETAGSIWLCLEIVMGASGTNSAINFSAIYDLETNIILP